MEVSVIISAIIPTCATIIVGVILSKQIVSQKEMIDNYKNYIAATDWEKVKKFYEGVEIPKLKREFLGHIHNFEDLHNELYANSTELHTNAAQLDAKRVAQIKELITFILLTLKQFPKEQAIEIIEQRLPNCKPYLLKYLDKL